MEQARLLQDRIAVITGSDSGIGRAIALAFAEAGAHVAISWHTDEAGAREVAAQVGRAGRRALVQQLEVRDERSVAMFFDAADRALGRADILVNDAGIGAAGKPADRTTTAEFDDVIRTDLYGPFFCCREFIRRRRPEGGGKILNITSVHEVIPSPGNIAYGAAKGALLAMTRTLAMELAPLKVNVNAIAPGLIRTPMTQQRIDDRRQAAAQLPRIPWQRAGEPQEVARLALYLASPEADYVTGQSFTIDGGLEMNWGQGV